MVNRLVSVGDDFKLPPAVNVENENLPDNLQPAALSATFVNQVSGLVDDDATDNRAVLQAAVDLGGTVILPATTGRYAVTGTININVPGTKIQAHGAPIRQTLKTTIFDVDAADVNIDGLRAYGALGAPNVSGLDTTWRDSNLAASWTAVNACSKAHRLTIPWIHGSGMASVVRFSHYDKALGMATAGYINDVTLGTVIAEDVEFGWNGRDVQRLTAAVTKGTYGQAVGSSRQPHLAYLAASTVNSPGSLAVTIGEGVATDAGAAPSQGQAFQFKHVTGLQIGTLQARNCYGVLNIMDCEDAEIGNVLSIGDKYARGTWGNTASVSVDYATVVPKRIHFGNVKVNMATDSYSVLVRDCEDVTFDSIEVNTAHSAVGASTSYDVELGGLRTIVRKAKVINTGTNAWKAVGFMSGTGHRLEDITATNVRVAVDVRGSDAVVLADPSKITLHSTDGLYNFTADSSVGNFGGAKIKTPTNGVLFEPRVLFGDEFDLPVGTARTLDLSTTGQKWTTQTGAWRIDTSGDAYDSGGTTNRILARDTGQANAELEAVMKWQSGEGVCFRIVDNQNFLYAILSSTSVVIAKNVAGAGTNLATFARAHTAGRFYKITAKVFGPQIDVFVDGEKVLSHTLTGGDETTFAAGTQQGLRSSNAAARFRYFRAVALQ